MVKSDAQKTPTKHDFQAGNISSKRASLSSSPDPFLKFSNSENLAGSTETALKIAKRYLNFRQNRLMREPKQVWPNYFDLSLS